MHFADIFNQSDFDKKPTILIINSARFFKQLD